MANSKPRYRRVFWWGAFLLLLFNLAGLGVSSWQARHVYASHIERGFEFLPIMAQVRYRHEARELILSPEAFPEVFEYIKDRGPNDFDVTAFVLPVWIPVFLFGLFSAVCFFATFRRTAKILYGVMMVALGLVGLRLCVGTLHTKWEAVYDYQSNRRNVHILSQPGWIILGASDYLPYFKRSNDDVYEFSPHQLASSDPAFWSSALFDGLSTTNPNLARVLQVIKYAPSTGSQSTNAVVNTIQINPAWFPQMGTNSRPFFVQGGAGWIGVPNWFGALSSFVMLIIPGWWLIKRTRRGKMDCRCGYNLTGNTSGTCPECGRKLKAFFRQVNDGCH